MENVRKTKIEEVMTGDYFHLDPSDAIDKAAFIFSNNDVHSILLVDGKHRVRGVVKAVDVISKLRKSEVKLKTIAVNSP
ncbi:MAG: CBS domain-containing protein, partial [Candidatus Hodarchaeales archaeon]